MSFTLSRWNFPSNNYGSFSGIGDSGIETFKGSRIKSLGREICQNSLDANADSSMPTKVQFKSFDISTSNIPDVESLKIAIDQASKFGINQRDTKAKHFFTVAKKALAQEHIHCLRISDFNTTGLSGSHASDEEASPWRDLTKSQGVSEKSGSNGGSFGIGKFAPYACSCLRTVFYSTIDDNDNKAYQGVCRITSFKGDDGDVKQGTGFFGREKNTPVFEQISFDEEYTRNESGTDLFILGFIDEPEWIEKLIASILDGFLYAVFTDKLTVDIDGIEISKQTLHETITKYKSYCEEYAYDYYRALTRTESNHVFEGDILSLGKVTLNLILQHDMCRRVAMVRKTGMKIMDKGNISGLIKFSGLMYIEGEKLNTFLRSMENPQHTKWEDDRADDPAKAKQIKKELTRFIKRCLEELKNESDDDEVNASVGEYLTAERDPDAHEERSENIIDDIKSFTEREVKIRKPREDDLHIPGDGKIDIDNAQSEQTTEEDEETGGHGNVDSEDTTRQGNGSRDQQLDHQGGGSGGETRTNTRKVTKVGITPSKMRIMADSSKKGSYIIAFTPAASAESCTFAVFLSAESDRYEANIISAENLLTGDILEVSDNTISGLSFIENETIKVKLTINYKDYCSMEVRAYGYKI